jgi:NADH:ubiquinone oxidoreductase subunit D
MPGGSIYGVLKQRKQRRFSFHLVSESPCLHLFTYLQDPDACMHMICGARFRRLFQIEQIVHGHCHESWRYHETHTVAPFEEAVRSSETVLKDDDVFWARTGFQTCSFH